LIDDSDEIGTIENRRMKAVFFERTFPWLRMDAILALVIPFERLADSSRHLQTEAYERWKGQILRGTPTEPDEAIEFD
jgi:hypothetical protein